MRYRKAAGLAHSGNNRSSRLSRRGESIIQSSSSQLELLTEVGAIFASVVEVTASGKAKMAAFWELIPRAVSQAKVEHFVPDQSSRVLVFRQLEIQEGSGTMPAPGFCPSPTFFLSRRSCSSLWKCFSRSCRALSASSRARASSSF